MEQRTSFEIESSNLYSFYTAAPAIELSSELGFKSYIQFKFTKYFRDDLTLVFVPPPPYNKILGVKDL